MASIFHNRSLERLSRLAPPLLALLIGPAVFATAAVWLNCKNDIEAWAAPGSPAQVIQTRFRCLFGWSEVLAISWDGADLADERLERFEACLSGPDNKHLFHSVTSTSGLVKRLRAKPISLKSREAYRAVAGWALQPPPEDQAEPSALISASLSEAGVEDRRSAIRAVHQAADECGVPAEELRIGGNGYWLSEIDRQSVVSPLRVVPLIAIVVFLGIGWRLGSWVVAGAVMTVGLGAATLTTASIYWSGVRMNAVMSTLPTLVFLIGVANCLHLANHFLAARTDGAVRAMRSAIAITWKPTLFSGVTTMLGLLALSVSDTEPIRQFGWFGAAGVAMAITLTLLFLPRVALLRAFSNDRYRQTKARYSQRSYPGMWRRLHELVWRRRRWVALLALVSAPLSVLGMLKLQTSVQPPAFFRAGSDQLSDARWLEERFCGLDAFDVVVAFPSESPLRPVDQLLQIKRVRASLEAIPGVDAVVSADRFAPNVTERSGSRHIARRAVVNDFLEKNHVELEDLGLLNTESEGDSWRINVRVSYVADSVAIQRKIEQTLSETLGKNEAPEQGEAQTPGLGASWWIAGSAKLFRDVERQFLRDLASTYLAGFLAVSVAVFLLLGSLRSGLIAMIPNALPGIAVLGLVGWFGFVLEVGSIMTASVALGIAVDDTMHYLAYVQRRLKSGASLATATLAAMQNCGGAMAQTSVICGGGIGLFAACTFLPTVRFGLLLSSMLILALVADLILLPALLALTRRVWVSESPTA